MDSTTIEREKIINSLGNLLDEVVLSLRAINSHFTKTQLKEIKNQIAYRIAADKIDKDIKTTFEDKQTLEQYISVMNHINTLKNCRESSFLTKMIPGSVIVSAISTLDYYIYQILYALLNYDGHLASVVEIKLPYKDINTLNDCKDIREYCLSTFLEGLFLGSHDDLFETISKKFNLRSIKNISGYKDFLFATELRNIIVHHDSIISLKFKLNMEKYKIDYKKFDFFNEDGELKLDPNYTFWIIDTCLSVSLQLYLEICEHYSGKRSKLVENYIDKINSICVELIAMGYSNVCCTIYDVLLSRKNYKEDKHLFIINKALCLKEMENFEEMRSFLDTIDLNECEEQFILAKNILLENYEEAVKYMDKVDLQNWDCGYQDWPLCKSFVKTDLFKSQYESIYGHKYEKKVSRRKLSEKEVLKIFEEFQESQIEE